MKKGYTLIEMIVVIALLGLVGVAVVAMFLTTTRSGGKSGALALVKEEGDYAITTMERYIHFAKTLDCTGAPTSVSIIRDNNGTDQSVQFLQSGSQLMRNVNGGGNEAITSTKVIAQNLSFTCSVVNKVNTVDFNFTLSNPGEAVVEVFGSKVVLRNKGQ